MSKPEERNLSFAKLQTLIWVDLRICEQCIRQHPENERGAGCIPEVCAVWGGMERVPKGCPCCDSYHFPVTPSDPDRDADGGDDPE